MAEVDGSFATHTCTFETNGDFICSIKSSQHCKNRDYRCTVREGGVTASANITTSKINLLQQKVSLLNSVF